MICPWASLMPAIPPMLSAPLTVPANVQLAQHVYCRKRVRPASMEIAPKPPLFFWSNLHRSRPNALPTIRVMGRLARLPGVLPNSRAAGAGKRTQGEGPPRTRGRIAGLRRQGVPCKKKSSIRGAGPFWLA